jgi:hypothetical protein
MQDSPSNVHRKLRDVELLAQRGASPEVETAMSAPTRLQGGDVSSDSYSFVE